MVVKELLQPFQEYQMLRPTDAGAAMHSSYPSLPSLEKLTQQLVSTLTCLVGINTEALNHNKISRSEKIDLFYFGPTSLDVIIFVGSAISFRCYLWWQRPWRDERNGRQSPPSGGDDTTSAYTAPPAHKAEEWKPHKDPSLYRFMAKAKEQKQNLRQVVDPEQAMKVKMQHIKFRQCNSSGTTRITSGPPSLGLSQRLLEDKRQGLKETGRPLVDLHKKQSSD
jgi:hypothetical protein